MPDSPETAKDGERAKVPAAPAQLAQAAPPAPLWHLYVPKLVTILRQGYGFADFRADCLSGLTVAIVALPLAMALAIASGTTPDKGLLTAIVAGFLISALGGSRFQIGGPTGAFVVVVFATIDRFGYDGLILATLMAGGFLILAALLRFGAWIKYIPEPVVTGFTAGIAVIIASSQIRDIFGLALDRVPGDFFAKMAAFWAARESFDAATLAIAIGAFLLILILRRYRPHWPAFLIAIIAASLLVALLGLPVATIASRFGGLPDSLPVPHWPEMSLARLKELLPSAFTIAFLAGIESLLSAMVADGMTGRRHRSNCELLAQGIANIASALFGGMPATGAIARTATNIRSGARSPVSGMLHAIFVLLFLLLAAKLADYIPLASLGAVLIVVAWNMSDIGRFRHLLRGPWGDRLVLLTTFGLTIAIDLTVAIEIGIVLAAILFMHRMSEVAAIGPGGKWLADEIDDFARPTERDRDQRQDLPEGIAVFQLRGPFFFAVAGRLADAIEQVAETPRVFILRLREVPLIDSSGAAKLGDFLARCRERNAVPIFSGLQPQPRRILEQMRILPGDPPVHLAADYPAAIALARQLLGERQDST